MKALVAGGAGFIGSHLVDALLAEGHQVICIDNFFIGTRENIVHLSTCPEFKLYEVDLSDLEAVRKIFAIEEIDYVFHLAANSDIQASAGNPGIELKNTAITTFNLLSCMREFSVKKLFFASTSAVYGEQPGLMLSETSVPLTPISYYGSAKLASEAFISAFAHMNDLSVLIFRFPNVIGDRLTHGVIFDFIRKLRKDPSQLEILGDGSQCKPYMYVDDLIRGIMQLKETPNGISLYNIGVESKTTVTRIAELVCEGLGLKDVAFHYTGGNIGWKGDVPTFAYDLAKIYATGWKAYRTSDEAVAATVCAAIEDGK